MPLIELHFPVLGSTLPADHGYALYSALSRVIPQVHEDHTVGIGPIGGQYIGNGRLQIDAQRSRLRLRLAPENIAGVLALVFAALALQHFIAVFRSQPDVCWGAGTVTRFRMSRLSRFVLALWFLYITACIVIRFLLKMPGSPYYLAGHAAFALLVVLTRWADTGRFRL